MQSAVEWRAPMQHSCSAHSVKQCPTFIGASPTTRKNARSPRQRPRPAAHRFQRSQTILRHVGCPAVDAKFTTAARRRRLFHNNVANRRHRSAVVHRRLIFIDCWPSALLAADDRAVSQPAHGTVVKVTCRHWRRDVIACMLMSAAHSISSAAAGAGAAWELATIHCRPPAAPSLVTTRPTQSRAPLSAAQKTSTLHCVSELQQ